MEGYKRSQSQVSSVTLLEKVQFSHLDCIRFFFRFPELPFGCSKALGFPFGFTESSHIIAIAMMSNQSYLFQEMICCCFVALNY